MFDLLTNEEKQRPYAYLMKYPAAKMPKNIHHLLNHRPSIEPLPFSKKNRILTEHDLQQDLGFTQLPSGGWLVAMQCEMPGITREMIDWWFWWHAQESLRYKIWLPGEHLSISTRLDDADYFKQPFTGFQANTQYPVAMSGKRKAEFTIKYVTPTDFGFDQSLFKENNIEAIVCGHVGLLRGRLALAEMAHIFKNTSDGLLVMSRYWIGEPLPFKNRPEDSFLNKIGGSKTIKQKIFTEEKAYNTAEHCCREFRRLAKILPDLYEKYATTN